MTVTTLAAPLATHYVGQVERDPDGHLWAVLYCQERILAREQVRTLRRGKRRVAGMVLSAADIATPAHNHKPAQQEIHETPENPRGYEMSPGWDRLRAAHAT